jgi:translation initiation factor 4E
MEVDNSKPESLPKHEGENGDAKKENTAVVPASPASPDLNLEIKHPLQHRWTMWYDNAGKRTSQSSWGDHLRKIVTIDTVEDFWGLYNNIVPASKLAAGANYHLFKEGIEPKWEDPENERGGKWILTIPPKTRATGLDKMWLWTLLACIGEAFEDESDVTGCVVSVRRAADKIALWTKNGHNDAVARRIGRQLKASLELPDNQVIGYQVHADCMKKNSSFNNKNRYEV